METKHLGARILTDMFVQGAIELSDNKSKVDSLNVFPVPDGDTGTNMSLTMNQAMEFVTRLQNPCLSELVQAISKGCLMGARGNSGVILSQIFRGFAYGIDGKTQVTTSDFADALLQAKTTAYKAVLKPVEGTMLTVIKDIADSATQAAADNEDFEGFIKKLLEVGVKSLANTPNQLKPLKDAGVVDSGGTGLLFIFAGFYRALSSEIFDLSRFTSNIADIAEAESVEKADIVYTYCTEFILRTGKDDIPTLKNLVISSGDSVVYVNDGEYLKVHVHTDDPGRILSEAIKHGEIVKTKIENMREQHSELIEGSHANLNGAKAVTKTERQAEEKEKYGFIAVCAGEGVAEILRSLGVNEIIEGGQTMNPSTSDIYSKLESLNCENIFIFPNNSNIIMAAKQAAELSDKNVVVLETKTVPQAIACMMAFNDMADPEDNLENFISEMSNIKTLQITHAIRDTVYEDIEIKNGDYLGILESKIVKSTDNIKDTILESLAIMVDDDTELLSLYYGEDVSEEEAEEMEEAISDEFPDLEISVHFGGQPVYYYLISAE